jgi:rubrerythrin
MPLPTNVAADLEAVLAVESTCAARNQLYAALARKAGQTGRANLLQALAAAEEIGARRALHHLRGKVGDPGEHLRALQRLKAKAAADLHPRRQAAAAAQGEPGAAGYFRQQAEVAAGHAALLAAHLEGDPAQDFFLCQVCGYIAPQAAPERCPVCGAVHAKFTAVAA